MRAPCLSAYSIRGRAIVVRVERFVADALLLRASFVVEFAARYVHSPRNALGFRILRSYSNSLSLSLSLLLKGVVAPAPVRFCCRPRALRKAVRQRHNSITPTSLREVRAVRSIYIFLSRLVQAARCVYVIDVGNVHAVL